MFIDSTSYSRALTVDVTGALGPRRPECSSTEALAVLDELEHPVIVLDSARHICHVNRLGAAWTDGGGPLRADGQQLVVDQGWSGDAFWAAVDMAAAKCWRRLVIMHRANIRACVSVSGLGQLEGSVLVMAERGPLGKLAIEAFAREHKLTPAETRTLVLLSKGHQPKAVAGAMFVELTTVRSHIMSIREKTATLSIAHLLTVMSRLPPLCDRLGCGR